MKKYIDYFQLKSKYETIKPFKCSFKAGLNVIVGENGSGKSTMLRLMSSGKSPGHAIKLVDKSKQTNFRYFDTEKDNPRLNQIDWAKEKNPLFALSSHFMSHGEAILPLIQAIEDFKNEVVFIDEPDAGLSLTNQKKIITSFKRAVKNGCQIILTTHSYVIIKNTKEVFSLDTRKWIPSSEYLEKI